MATRETVATAVGRAPSVGIVCSGATDRLLPVPGWQYAGTYSLGGSQLVLKSQGCAIGRRVAGGADQRQIGFAARQLDQHIAVGAGLQMDAELRIGLMHL